MTAPALRPFRAEIPQSALDDLRARLQRALWPDDLPAGYGVTNERVRALAEHWLERFDWRAFEARLNAYPQFTTEIDGETIHFLHVRSSRADATPLVLTHGWPGSVAEYLDVIGPLTEPESPEAPAFHLVIPSLPGFGFSGPVKSAGWGTHRTAAAWAELMSRLGYESYGAAGNDAGSMISPEIGRLAPEKVVGVHVTQLFSFPSGDPAEMADLSEADQGALAHLQWFYENMFSFNQLHSQQPHTLAFALADSPLALLAWNAQLFGESLDADFVLANVALYWLTGTGGSSIRFYYEDAQRPSHPAEPTTVPTALAMFKGDFQSIRRFADRDHANIVSWNSYDAGTGNGGGPRDAAGHYAAHEAPEILVADIRRFFDGLSRPWPVLDQAHAALRSAIEGVEDWSAPTPCADWNITQVLQHAAADQLGYAAFITGEPGPDFNPFAPSGTLTESPSAYLEPKLAAAEAAFATITPDATAVPTPLPQGALPAPVAVGAAALDATVHAWDIATATGRKSLLTNELAEALLPVAKELAEPLRGFAYAPALPALTEDDAVSTLLRYLGRNPHWTA
ncbi:TIGR03086 family metal-binding protein [Amycolatopsis sp. WQ 127309]|uniref:TIGR03086 family metal-binding protein n=1 Tax=Amycolatopsis sp. WQ 127309 TaxID=2932773 RepID=UPI001FF3D395|nr:TIGR03086 family metal-binding protein [Amycolatopsis sp. WQ 127309]UOZ10312.1 TIGR03086 family metal-binding protein [Amycolatopsis sp. WQ 127309]